MIHQHFMLVESLTVAENMVLGAETGRGIFFDLKEAKRRTAEISEKFDLRVNPDLLVKDLSVGYKQRVEILKMLLRGAQILLLDEPTAVLTPQETKELFIQLKKLKQQGFSFVFISHKLHEIKEICDRVTVIRAGKVVGSADIDEVSENDISRMMVGRDIILTIGKKKAKPGQPVLKIRNLSHVNQFGLFSFRNVNFDVRAGEILGVAGVEGNGQAELADTIAGLLPIQDGEITVKDVTLRGKSIREIRELGISLVHEDRMIYGASREQSISENIVVERYYKPEYCNSIFLRLRHIQEKTTDLISQFLIKCDGPSAAIKTLSGGNIQKVVAAREFSSSPELLIACHPTRGIDVGATEMIRKKMISLRDETTTAILLFSADLNELLTVSDSIVVMNEGRIVAYFSDINVLTEQILGEYMLGLKKQGDKEIGGVVYA
jgi:simple sugar transport system ATP-binding protein